MSKARLHLFLSLAFLLSSIALYSRVAPVEAPIPEPVPIVASQDVSTFVVEGVWEQYYVNGDGQREFMARLDLRQSGDSYTANPLALAADAYPKHAYCSFDHEYDNGIWSFKEQWSCRSVGQFDLVLQPNGEYEGYAYSANDGQGFRTVFVRVE